MGDLRRVLSLRGDQIKKSNQAFKFCFCFRRMFKLINAVPLDIVYYFKKYSDSNRVMTFEKLKEFLKDIQGEDIPEKAEQIFNQHVFQREGLNLDTFLTYLLGDLNPPHDSVVHHDMEKPLSHYFLFTGHNSYLTGNQLCSSSSTELIIKALRTGVRVIELDLWPRKKHKHDIKVCHGGTMTSPVELIKCLEAIRDHAFIASDYPVIITFEDHLTPDLRKKVAQMVHQTFGKKLYTGEKFLEFFPSPEELKEKILISTKPPNEFRLSEDQETKEHTPSVLRRLLHLTTLCESFMVKMRQYFRDRRSMIKDFSYISGSDKGSRNSDELLDIEIKDNEEDDEESMIPEYEHLIAIHAVKGTRALKSFLKEEDSKRVARLSMSEEEIKDEVKTHATDIVRFTQRNLLRVYPKGSRLLSSNYDPMVGWTHGAQMVAFNMQGYEKYLWIMQGMFRANGGCGYVKKPDFLLSNEPFDPSIRKDPVKKLKVKLYMGYGWHLHFRPTHFDRCSPPDFFAKVEVRGVKADKKKETTKVINNQWIPMWNKEFEFPLTAPELALLRIEVCDNDLVRRGFGGQTCLPISELKTGIRAVPLYCEKGLIYERVKLLMRFQILPAT